MQDAGFDLRRDEAFGFRISDHTCIRVYSGSRPHNWKIADLQKGLVLVYDDVEMVGEGTGLVFRSLKP
jgi:hypothetical protein